MQLVIQSAAPPKISAHPTMFRAESQRGTIPQRAEASASHRVYPSRRQITLVINPEATMHAAPNRMRIQCISKSIAQLCICCVRPFLVHNVKGSR